jgi:protoporphyrinogen/coproporphyrinogen III oxidase
MSTRPHVVVIGGGISGLTAAWRLSQLAFEANETVDVTVLESSDCWGGKIQTTPFAGRNVDTAADAFLARVPYATALCEELGIDELIAPSPSGAWLWSRDELRRFPTDTMLGVPSRPLPGSDTWESGAVSRIGLLRATLDYVFPRNIGRNGDDSSIAEIVGTRLGREVVERLVDPLIGGINGGTVGDLSLEAAAPQLAAIFANNRSLIDGVHRQLRDRPPPSPDRPTFLAPRNGMIALPDALVRALADRSVAMQTNTVVTSVQRERDRWTVHSENNVIDADAVIIATPAFATATLVNTLAPVAAEHLRAVQYASVTMVRLAYPRNNVQHALDGSGFVVPATDGKLLTACSWATSKWPHLADDNTVIMRASVGRLRDRRQERMSDDELVTTIDRELHATTGVHDPSDVSVTRWERSFPQYQPGHRARVAAARHELSAWPTIAIAGAAYDGLGIPACIDTANRSATGVWSAIEPDLATKSTGT